ncbi:MAG: hypothetical protein WDZ30_11065 [Cellvibrionaceae bacterium]
MNKLYRSVIALLIGLSLAWYFFPWGVVYQGGSERSLTWLGTNAWLSDSSIVFISNVTTVLYLLSYLGLFFYQKWARSLLLFLAVVGGLAIPMYGLSVASGYESMLMYFISVGDGFLLAMSYFSVVKDRFGGRQE